MTSLLNLYPNLPTELTMIYAYLLTLTAMFAKFAILHSILPMIYSNLLLPNYLFASYSNMLTTNNLNYLYHCQISTYNLLCFLRVQPFAPFENKFHELFKQKCFLLDTPSKVFNSM